MKFSLATVLWIFLTISMAIALLAALNRPTKVFVLGESGFHYFEFDDRINEFEKYQVDGEDLTCNDLPHVTTVANQICSELSLNRDELGFDGWRIRSATFCEVSALDQVRHVYFVILEGKEYPAHVGVNEVCSVEMCFISRQVVLYSSEHHDDKISRFLPSHELIHDATPKTPNPSGGVFRP